MTHKIKIFFVVFFVLIKHIKYLPKTLYVNFKYLPFKKALKLPIFVYKVKLRDCTGTIDIDSDTVSFRMIHIGRDIAKTYANTGLIWDHKGRIVFKGTCTIGASSTIMVGKKGYLEFGNNFMSTTTIKIIAFHCVKFGNDNRVGWEVFLMDTTHHLLKNLEGKYISKGYGQIHIGANNWISTRSMVFAGAKTPNYCIVAANSFLNKDFSAEESKILLAGNPLSVKAKGIWRDFNDDVISNYEIYTI